MEFTTEYIEALNQAYNRIVQIEDAETSQATLRKLKDPWLKIRRELEELDTGPDFRDADASKQKISWLARLINACKPPVSIDNVPSAPPPFQTIANLAILDLLFTNDAKEQKKLTKDLMRLISTLTDYELDSAEVQLSKVLLRGLAIILNLLPLETAQEVLDASGHLINVQVGTLNKRQLSDPINTEDKDYLYDIINAMQYGQIIRSQTISEFLKHHGELTDLAKGIKCPVYTVAGRKGGTGKSTLLMGIISSYLKKNNGHKICILDFDFSGPTWRYLLFKGRKKPRNSLDHLLKLDQTLEFFGAPENADITELPEKAKWPFQEEGVYLLGLRDFPHIRRIVLKNIEAQKGNFYEFLVEQVTKLSAKFDAIFIDNGPGIDSLPLMNILMASTAPVGQAFLVSTPALYDLAGTFNDLSELKMLELNRAPIWVVNKATTDCKEFYTRNQNNFTVSKLLQASDQRKPDLPLLWKIAEKLEPKRYWYSILIDDTLHTLAYVDNEGYPHFPANFLGSEFAKEVDKLFYKVLLKQQQKESEQKRGFGTAS